MGYHLCWIKLASNSGLTSGGSGWLKLDANGVVEGGKVWHSNASVGIATAATAREMLRMCIFEVLRQVPVVMSCFCLLMRAYRWSFIFMSTAEKRMAVAAYHGLPMWIVQVRSITSQCG